MQFRALFILILFLSACSTGQQKETVPAGPFQAYLDRPDPYRYELHEILEHEGYSIHMIRMVSQNWLTVREVDSPEWWHWLGIVVPDQVDHETGLLWIGGGSRGTTVNEGIPDMMVEAALATNSITAHLHNVPFQPIGFVGDSKEKRYEDDLIAYGWRKFLEGGAQDEDAVWLARLPMTKAAIRAMDTVSMYARNDLGLEVRDYIVGGASKRGWTTWTTAIFDDRVKAIVPVVIDLLNILPSFEHHWRAYGEWSPAIKEYEQEHIMDWQLSQEYQRLLELVDPHSYLDRLQLPKFLINGASDEFFLPDSWKFYWDDLPGDKHIRYVPNAGHSLNGTDATMSMISFHYRFLNGIDMPVFHWATDDLTLHIQTDPDNPPSEMRLWQNTNPDGRDFRLYVVDKTWTYTRIEPDPNGHYTIGVDEPGSGYTAFFVEALYDDVPELPLKLTTGVMVTPDTYPFGPFVTNDPKGTPLNGVE